MKTRTVRVQSYDDPHPCNRCGQMFYVWSLDVLCPAIPKRKHSAVVPEGWAPLILLCDACWRDVVAMFPKGILA
jgi:hypothetical protein